MADDIHPSSSEEAIPIYVYFRNRNRFDQLQKSLLSSDGGGDTGPPVRLLITPPLFFPSGLTASFRIVRVDRQDKYVFDYVFDAGQKAVGGAVPKSFKGQQDDFFTAANIRFAKTTGVTYVARPAELPKGRS